MGKIRAECWDHIIFPAETIHPGEKSPVIRQLCFGPLETVEYGVLENGAFYWENKIIEGIGEGDSYFEIIDKESFLKAADNEIRLCKEHAPQLLEQVKRRLDAVLKKLNLKSEGSTNYPLDKSEKICYTVYISVEDV